MQIDGQELELDYPCRWSFTVIGSDEARLRGAVAEVVGDTDHDLVPSRRSSGGRYLSLVLSLEVRDEAHRTAIWEGLAAQAVVKFVL